MKKFKDKFGKWAFVIVSVGGDYIVPACRDEISTRPAENHFTLRLHVEIKFRPSKAGQFAA